MNSRHPHSSSLLLQELNGTRYRCDLRTSWRLLRWWLAAFACALASLLLAVPASACGQPSVSGNPNQQCAGVGNPINVMTGNKYQREEDMPALPGVLGLELVRHYNSAFSAPGYPNGPLGRGWRLSYETEIVDIYGKIQVLEADGGRIIFDRDPKSPTGCGTSDPANGTMTLGRQLDGKPDYTWTRTDGRKLHFNSAGKLDRITAPTGEMVRLLYDSQNVLVRVIDPQGRSLNLVYYDRKTPNQFHGVQFIDTPVGRFAYEYGSSAPKGAGLFDQRQLLANLVRVRLPDHFDPDKKAHALSSRGTTRSTLSRIYHHEDPRSPWLMTGISIETIGADGKPVATRYATFGYDDTGRAILSTHAGNVDKVTLDNHEAGKTVLTNSLGQKTVYRYTVIAGEYRLLEVRGAGCALCSEPNIRYGYDDVGRRTETTKLAEDGTPLVTARTDRDKLGRVTRVSKILYEHGTPRPAQLQVRFEYRGNTFAPTTVVRPSVVPGKELVTRIDYNAAGQPLTIFESGWSPAADGKQAATRIERTIRYHYAVINGRSVLTEIGRPLPTGKTNSRADPEVTIFEYDHRPASAAAAPAGALARYDRQDGLLTRVIAPGNHVTEVLERDAALRQTRLRTTDGNLVQEFSVNTNWRGAPLHLELAAGALRRMMDYEYDPLGQLAAVTMPSNLRVTFAGDNTGRRGLTALPDGDSMRGAQALQLPALSRDVAPLIEAARLEAASSEVAAPTADTDKQPDTVERIQIRTGVLGSTSEHIVEELFHVAHGEHAVLARRWLDDFGRLVAVQYAGQGITRATYYGGSEHVATLTDATGIVTQLAYNARGQLTMLERMGRDGKLAERIQYKHQGSWLAEVTKYSGTSNDKPENRIRFVRNGFGQITEEFQASGTTSYCVNHTYDDAGRQIKTWITEHCGTAQSHDLPAVSMRYVSDARLGGQIDSIRAGDGWFGQRIVVSALRWLLGSPPLATAWRFGNGLQAQAQFEALKGKQTSFAWRLRGFDDGVHRYTISSDASGHIDAASQQERGTLGENDSWHLMLEAQAAPAVPAALKSSGTIAVASVDIDADDFDAAGRMRSYRSGQSELDLTWDSAGRLVQVNRDGKRVASYAYDGQGRRISKTVDAEPGANRMFIYSGEQLIAETAADGTILKQFVYLGWRPVAWIEPAHTLMQRVKQYLFGPKIVYLHTDHRGAVTAATDGDQRILWDSNVDAFGNLHGAGNDHPGIEQPLRLAGQYADRETGLYYNLARYYDPHSGDFLSPDPAGLGSGSLDLYAYAAGDPLNYFDPDGWAKIQYFAIDSGVKVGPNLQPDAGRWAFIITDIAGQPGDTFIYDRGGSFLADGKNYELITDATAASSAINQFASNYRGKSGYYSPAAFTVQMSDTDASGLIESLTGVSLGNGTCPANLNSVLPAIPLGVQGTLTPTAAFTSDPARLISCPTGTSANDILERRIQKAIEIHEVKAGGTIATDKDCSTANYLGCAANTWNPALKPGTTNVQPASYGWTQFTPVALADALKGLSTADLATLGITNAQVQDLAKKIAGVKKWYDQLVKNGTPVATTVAAGWAANQVSFVADTGLAQVDYDRMVAFGQIGATLHDVNTKYKAPPYSCTTSPCFWTKWQADDPTAEAALLQKASTALGASKTNLNPYIRSLSNMGEGNAGFQWAAIIASPIGQSLLTSLADKSKSDVLAKSFLDQKMKKARANLNLTGNDNLTAQQELQLATMTLALQNGIGNVNRYQTNEYAQKVLPHFKTIFCLDGSATSTNGYLRMDQLKVTK